MTDCMEHLIKNNSQEMSKIIDDKLNTMKTEMLTTMNTKLDLFLNNIWQMHHANNNSSWCCDWIVFDIAI
jgi:hypothetical protein